ncbi:MAG: phospholipase [Kiritimatiellaeota bacterium]|nr:phospholipase [Kiritimatiellota bacterium]
MKNFFLAAWMALGAAGCATSSNAWFPPDPEAGRQIARWVAAPTEEDPSAGFQCWVYLPTHYASQDETRVWPLLLFLHGSGENGDNIDKVRGYGLPRILSEPDRVPKNWPFITVSPQSPRMWFKPAQLVALLDTLGREYRVDAKRVYATGLSMGGIGAWELGAFAPGRLAAIAPICGAGRPGDAARLVNLPVWAFHGADDKNVRPSGPFNMGPVQGVGSATMVEAIQHAGGKKAKITLYPDAGHNVWDRVYGDPALYKWLLSHSL